MFLERNNKHVRVYMQKKSWNSQQNCGTDFSLGDKVMEDFYFLH